MSAGEQPLSRQQRFGLRVVLVCAVLLVITAVVAIVALDADATATDYVLRLIQVGCGGSAAVASAWRLRRDATR